VQTYLLNPISLKLISGEFKEGDNIVVDAGKKDKDDLDFKDAQRYHQKIK
jgi:ATP-dependent Clp protease ATP-binding subunit ClpB